MRISITVLLVGALFLLSCQEPEPVIVQFRGPDRSGIYHDTELLKEWPDSALVEVFYVDSLGSGYGSPVISDGRIYLTGAIDSMAILHCLDMDGNIVWQTNLGKEWVSNFPGSRSAPTIVDDLIYVGTGMGNLYCVNTLDGEVVWRLDFDEDFKGILPLFGHSESPYVLDDAVFWTAGGKVNNVLAIDRFNGALIWACEGKNERSAYHPPRVITTPSGRRILVTFSAYHMMGIDVETGDLIWTHEQDNYPLAERKPGYGDTHANTIIYEDNYIYYAAGDGNCGVKLALSEDGTTLNEIWRNKGFDSYMGGIIMIDNHIYGSGTAKPQLRSIDAESGQLTDSLQIGRGVVIAADDMIYYYSQNGRVYLVRYDEGNMDVISEFRITKGTKEHFAHPIIHEGVLYIRRGHSLMGFSISKLS